MKNRKFNSAAYTGRRVRGAMGDLVIDLNGLSTPWPNYPILRQHDADRIAGQSNEQHRIGNHLKMRGEIYGSTPAGSEVINLDAQGFKWQASVGIEIQDSELIPEGKRVTVNGAAHEGPIVVIRKSTLREVSAVPAGADGDTTLELMDEV